MKKFIEITGRSEAVAIESALQQLKLERDDVSVEVLDRAKSGFLGFGQKPARVRVTYEVVEEVSSDLQVKKEEIPSPPPSSATPPPVIQEETKPLVTILSQEKDEENASITTVSSFPVDISLDCGVSSEKVLGESPIATETPAKEEIPVIQPVEVSFKAEEILEEKVEENLQGKAEEIQQEKAEVKPQESPEVSPQGSPEESLQEKAEEKPQGSPEESLQGTAEEKPQVVESTAEKGNFIWEDSGSKKSENTVKKGKKSSKDYSKSKKEFSLLEKQEIERAIVDFLSGLMDRLHLEANPVISFQGEVVDVKLEGENLASLIGRRGETLDAIQNLTTYVVQKNCKKRMRLFLDAENYRGKREETLIKLAEKMAGQAEKHKRNVPMEPMNAFERHIIHEALTNFPKVYTYSTGSDPNRHIVVAYSGGENGDSGKNKGNQGKKGKNQKQSHYQGNSPKNQGNPTKNQQKVMKFQGDLEKSSQKAQEKLQQQAENLSSSEQFSEE